MKLGFVLVCDAARLRADGLFDTIGAGAQAVLVDPADRLFKRTVVLQLICDPEDVGRERLVDVALVSAGDEAVIGVQVSVNTSRLAPAGPEVLGPAVTPMDWRALHCAVHLVQVLDEEGDYRVMVLCDGEPLGEWALRVLIRDPETLRQALRREGDAAC
jgi:hypothetical protein